MNSWKTQFEELALPRCQPPFWARGGHGQTLIAHMLPSVAFPTGAVSHLIDLPDGDRLWADYFAADQDQAVVYLFHGLGGSTQSDYMRRTTRLALNLSCSVMAVNHRGCGQGRGLASAPYHSGRGEDLAAAIAYGRKCWPEKQHIAIGFSLSGNALLLLMAGERGCGPPDFAIAVNAPIHLGNAARAISRGQNRFYDLRFSLRCERMVRQRYRDGLLAQKVRFPWNKSLMAFDRVYTAPAGGFVDPEDYYHRCSAGRFLDRVTVPTVVLTSKDDPMVLYRDYLASPMSSQIHFHLEPHGGHMGYLTRKPTPLGDFRWLDYSLFRYLQTWLAYACP